MNTIELRNIINDRILLIDDEAFLVALKTIIDTKVSPTTYKLSAFQKERILLGREQLSIGNSILNEDIEAEIDQWLRNCQ